MWEPIAAYWNATIGRDTGTSDYHYFLCSCEYIGNVLKLAIVPFGDLGNGHCEEEVKSREVR